MAILTKESIKNLIKLSRIDCTEEEQDALLLDLEKIVGLFNQLEEVDTENVSPCNQVIEGMANVMRDDIVGEAMPRETFLSNAPSQIGGMIRVPPVLKSS
ncbi:MAG TPA: Asp-tRNA(Asn)/Glu-tRNA(Gln) amidotransferase subunit GatC [Parachlamydiaceae bacterium]|nr:Asp-tRNA(Asn)/Glu-tRNA(Gln) amidotransferase subunit GatC [Parachlamydiaceae bacterium]